MLILLSIWLVVGIALIVSDTRRDSAGLPLAYFLSLSLIYVPGAMFYLEDVDSIFDATKTGFELTVIGMVSFLVGVVTARHTTHYFTVGQVRDINFQRAGSLDRCASFYHHWSPC